MSVVVLSSHGCRDRLTTAKTSRISSMPCSTRSYFLQLATLNCKDRRWEIRGKAVKKCIRSQTIWFVLFLGWGKGNNQGRTPK